MEILSSSNPLNTIQLDNGLYLVLYRLRHRNTLSVNLRVDSGSRCETDQQHGLAHLVEHVLFQGTHRWPSNYELTSQVESLGGTIWGATHTEYNSYWLNVPCPFFAQSLPIFADMLQSPLFSAAAIESEKQVIVEELAELREEGWIMAQRLLDKALWWPHELGRSVMGTKESVLALGQADVQAHFEQNYAPNRMVAAVVGDIEAQKAIELFEQVWTDQRELPSRTYKPPSKTRPQLLYEEQENSNVVHIMLGFITPGLDHPDWGGYTLLRMMLGEGMSSRLYTVLRSKGLCYSVESDFDELRHACVLTIYIATQPANVVQVFEEVGQVFRSLNVGDISQESLENVRKLAIGSTLIDADRAQFHARNLSLTVFLTGKALSLEEQLSQLEKVDLAQLYRLTKEIITPDNLYGGIFGSLSEETLQRCRNAIKNW